MRLVIYSAYHGRMNIQSAVIKACEIAGGVTALATQLDVAQSFVSQWKSGKRPVPIDKVLRIERLTRRQVLGEDLRPDLNVEFYRKKARAKSKAA